MLAQTAKPNPAHAVFAELHRRGKLLRVITQNIDGLHCAAGVPAADVVELHGSAHTISCVTYVPSSSVGDAGGQGSHLSVVLNDVAA